MFQSELRLDAPVFHDLGPLRNFICYELGELPGRAADGVGAPGAFMPNHATATTPGTPASSMTGQPLFLPVTNHQSLLFIRA